MNLHLQGWCFALQSSSATMGPEEYLSKPTSSTSSFLRHDFPTCFSAWNWAGTYMWRSRRQNNENFQTSFQLCSIWTTSPFGLCIIHNLKMELLRWSIYLPCHIQGLACLHGCSAAISNTFWEVLLWSATLKIVLLLYIFGASGGSQPKRVRPVCKWGAHPKCAGLRPVSSIVPHWNSRKLMVNPSFLDNPTWVFVWFPWLAEFEASAEALMRRILCPFQQFRGSRKWGKRLPCWLCHVSHCQFAPFARLAKALFMIIVMTLVFGVYSLEDHGLFMEILWIFSTYLESISMLPQQRASIDRNIWKVTIHVLLRDGLATDTWICLRYIYCYRLAATVRSMCNQWHCVWIASAQEKPCHAGMRTTNVHWFLPMSLRWVATRWYLESAGGIISSSDPTTWM